LNGSEIAVGGSIIMPIDMVMVATTRSITRNGRTTRKPISKPRLISEIMKAGTRTRMSILPSVSVALTTLGGNVDEQVEILGTGVDQHELAKRIGNQLDRFLFGDLVLEKRAHAVSQARSKVGAMT
jgi:hypothetical protein